MGKAKVDLGIISFGKNAGKKWSEVKKEFLLFLISSECHTKKENKELAKKELENREISDEDAFL